MSLEIIIMRQRGQLMLTTYPIFICENQAQESEMIGKDIQEGNDNKG